MALRTLDLDRILGELGIVAAGEESDSNLMARCPLHDDADPSFSISRESGLWICFSGCGEGNLTQLVSAVLGLDRDAARDWLAGRGSVYGSEEAVLKLLEASVEDPKAARPLFFYEQSGTYRYMLRRGFTPETLKKWGVGKDSRLRAVVIPYRPTGEVLGLIYRFIDPERDPPYDYTPGMPASQHLFGWEHLPARPDRVIVVEGPLDVMWLHQLGRPAVGLCGSAMSAVQAAALLGRTREVTLALDNDDAGRKGTRRALKLLAGRVRVLAVRWDSDRKDVQECSKVAVLRLLEGAADALLTDWGTTNRRTGV